MLITHGIEYLFIRLPMFPVPKSNSFIIRTLLFHKMKMSNKKAQVHNWTYAYLLLITESILTQKNFLRKHFLKRW